MVVSITVDEYTQMMGIYYQRTNCSLRRWLILSVAINHEVEITNRWRSNWLCTWWNQSFGHRGDTQSYLLLYTETIGCIFVLFYWWGKSLGIAVIINFALVPVLATLSYASSWHIHMKFMTLRHLTHCLFEEQTHFSIQYYLTFQPIISMLADKSYWLIF